MELLTSIFSAFGLSASAGLNAYIPLLVIALVARYTELIKLASPWDTLTNPWVIGLLVVLLVIEFFADKAPAVNHINDLIQTSRSSCCWGNCLCCKRRCDHGIKPGAGADGRINRRWRRPYGESGRSTTGSHGDDWWGCQYAGQYCRRSHFNRFVGAGCCSSGFVCSVSHFVV